MASMISVDNFEAGGLPIEIGDDEPVDPFELAVAEVEVRRILAGLVPTDLGDRIRKLAEGYESLHPDEPILMFNPNHDHLGRFARGGGGGVSAAFEFTDHEAFNMENLSPKDQGRVIAAVEGRFGMPVDRVEKEIIRPNLERHFANGRPEDARWYDDAQVLNQEIGDRYGVPRDRVAAVVARTSALAPFKSNVLASAGLIHAYKTAPESLRLSRAQIDEYNSHATSSRSSYHQKFDGKPGKYRTEDLPSGLLVSHAVLHPSPGLIDSASFVPALNVVRGKQTVAEAIGGPKQRNFYSNLEHPDQHGRFTVDTWQYRAMAGESPITMNGKTMPMREWKQQGATAQKLFQEGPQVAGRRDIGGYPWYSKISRDMAAEHGVIPHGFQAITWNSVRGNWVSERGLVEKPISMEQVREAVIKGVFNRK